jgi:HEAT repeats
MAEATPLSSVFSGLHRSDLMKPSVITALTLVAVLLTIYSFQNQLGDFLILLYILPLVLASIWYPRYGLILIGIVVAGYVGIILYARAGGVSLNLFRYSLYMAIFVWIIAATSVFTMEGRAAISHTLNSLRGLPKKNGDRAPGKSRPGKESARPYLTDEDLDFVLEALHLPDPAAREVAIRSLGKSANPRAVAPLVALLGDTDRDTREHAVRALGALGEGAVEPLIRALADPDWHVRTGAAVALRIIGDTRAIEPLIRSLSDGNRFVRRDAVKSLGRIGDRRAVDPLIGALRDQDSGVRARAAIALGRLADPRARGPLQQLAGDPDPDVQIAVREAISKLK